MLSSTTQAAINRAIRKLCFPDSCTITAPGTALQPGRTVISACRFFAAEERYYQHAGTFILGTTFRFEVPAAPAIEVGSVVCVHGNSYTVDRVLGLRLDGELHIQAVRLRAER